MSQKDNIFVTKIYKYFVFVAKIYKFNVFDAKICNGALYESFGWIFCTTSCQLLPSATLASRGTESSLKFPESKAKVYPENAKLTNVQKVKLNVSRLKVGWGQISCRRRCGLPLTMCVLFMMCFSMINEKHGTSPGYKVARQRQSEKDKCCGITRHF